MAIPYGQFRYRVVGPIGKGGLGIVDEIEVIETNCEHEIGLRLARKRLGPSWAAHPTARERFEREIAAMRAMDGHPNIITVKGEDLGDGERFYCMPKCERSYRDVLGGAPSGFQWRSVAQLGITLANALAYAHSKGLIHRDLKPENILLDRLNNVFLADWGIGYFIHEQSVVMPKLTQFGGLGTAYYCSLEQWSGVKSHPAMDVYALGMTLAELIQGRQIPNFTIGAGVQIDVAPSSTYGARMFNTVLRQMTAILANKRVASMDQVVAFLGQALAASPPTPGGI